MTQQPAIPKTRPLFSSREGEICSVSSYQKYLALSLVQQEKLLAHWSTVHGRGLLRVSHYNPFDQV